jgi:hypothetical protein
MGAADGRVLCPEAVSASAGVDHDAGQGDLADLFSAYKDRLQLLPS